MRTTREYIYITYSHYVKNYLQAQAWLSQLQYFHSFAYLEVELIPACAIALFSINVYDEISTMTSTILKPCTRPCTSIGAVSRVRNILKTTWYFWQTLVTLGKIGNGCPSALQTILYSRQAHYLSDLDDGSIKNSVIFFYKMRTK